MTIKLCKVFIREIWYNKIDVHISHLYARYLSLDTLFPATLLQQLYVASPRTRLLLILLVVSLCYSLIRSYDHRAKLQTSRENQKPKEWALFPLKYGLSHIAAILSAGRSN